MGSRRIQVTVSKETPEFNLALLGAVGVGKSALAVKYITKRFIMEYDPTLEDTYTKMESVDSQDIIVRIMDTYDTEESSPDRYLKWAQGFIIVFSITSRASFDVAKRYLETVSQYTRVTGKDLPIALVANKIDLERYRTVSKCSGEELASQFECSLYETSAAEEYTSVCSVFQETVRDIARAADTQMQTTLQPLFISEGEKGGLLSPVSVTGPGRTITSFRRVKSPKTQDISNNKDFKGKEETKEGGGRGMQLPRRPTSGFRIFNKSFSKIFN